MHRLLAVLLAGGVCLAPLVQAAAADRSAPLTVLDAQPPRMVSAFFGLDHAMPMKSLLLCRQAPGLDGMPVTFSRRVAGPIDAAAFTITTRSGARLHPICATTAPADGLAKRHTVLLIGDLGREPADPPVSVAVTGSLPLDGGANAQGLSGPVIPLVSGPSLVLALGLKPGMIDSDCPAQTRQIVVAIWAGGVRPAPGLNQKAHRGGYSVTTQEGPVTPFALADIADPDNYVQLCLDTDSPAEQVHFAPGILVDPRGYLNPETMIEVSR